MANVLFTRTDTPQSKPITDGQFIFDTSGNGKMYLDVGVERMEMGGAMSVDPTLNKLSTNPIQNKAIAGVMLTSLNDIKAITSSGFIPDALAIKTLDSSLSNKVPNDVEGFSIGEDGNPYITYKVGADTVTKKLGSRDLYISSLTFNSSSKFGAGGSAGSNGSHRSSYSVSFDITDYTTLTVESGSATLTLSGGGKSNMTFSVYGGGTYNVTGYTNASFSGYTNHDTVYNGSSWGGGEFSDTYSITGIRFTS